MRSATHSHQRELMRARSLAALILLAGAGSCIPVVSASPFHDDEHGPRSLKEVVQSLIRASRENLRPLKTSRIEMHPSRDYWYEVETKLPGARTCRIYEHPQMVYRCEWNRPADVPVNTVY